MKRPQPLQEGIQIDEEEEDISIADAITEQEHVNQARPLLEHQILIRRFLDSLDFSPQLSLLGCSEDRRLLVSPGTQEARRAAEGGLAGKGPERGSQDRGGAKTFFGNSGIIANACAPLFNQSKPPGEHQRFAGSFAKHSG